jgi:hypothetical protein
MPEWSIRGAAGAPVTCWSMKKTNETNPPRLVPPRKTALTVRILGRDETTTVVGASTPTPHPPDRKVL